MSLPSIAYDEAVRLTPDTALVYAGSGNAKLNLEKYESALKDYNEAIRLKPDSVEAYTGRGNFKFRLGQYELALEDYNKAIQLKA